MNEITKLGTSYGGWDICLDLIKDGDTIIDAGLGEDISFCEELKKNKTIDIIGVDPTRKSINYVTNKNIENFKLIPKAIAPHGIKSVTMYRNSNPNHVSESVINDHISVLKYSYYEVDAISITEIRKIYPNISLIKMDIEGAEYDVLKECVGIKQICVEFHHFCLPTKTKNDTDNVIKYMLDKGYEILHKNNTETEFTLILK